MEILYRSKKGIKEYLKQKLSPDTIQKLQPYRKELNIIKATYQLNLNHGEVISPLRKIIRFANVTGRLIDRKWVLFYPNVPISASVIHKICLLKGWGMTNNPDKAHIAAIKWMDETYYEPDETLKEIGRNENVLNIGSLDISKTNVSEKFEKAFGYPLVIDPLVHDGPCLCKSETNALHDGFIVECPLKERKEGFVYQKLVDNTFDEEWVLDYRVPVFKGEIPFLYYQFRHMSNRFRRGRLKLEIKETEEVFTADEQDKIKRFCQEIHMDYGELDILRDRFDGRIYIVDANNTPSGPSQKLPEIEQKKALIRLSKAFVNTFIEKKENLAITD